MMGTWFFLKLKKFPLILEWESPISMLLPDFLIIGKSEIELYQFSKKQTIIMKFSLHRAFFFLNTIKARKVPNLSKTSVPILFGGLVTRVLLAILLLSIHFLI